MALPSPLTKINLLPPALAKVRRIFFQPINSNDCAVSRSGTADWRRRACFQSILDYS